TQRGQCHAREEDDEILDTPSGDQGHCFGLMRRHPSQQATCLPWSYRCSRQSAQKTELENSIPSRGSGHLKAKTDKMDRFSEPKKRATGGLPRLPPVPDRPQRLLPRSEADRDPSHHPLWRAQNDELVEGPTLGRLVEEVPERQQDLPIRPRERLQERQSLR